MDVFVQLVILFAVIFDPLASLMVFFTATRYMEKQERQRIATYAVLVASGLSLAVLLLGDKLLALFSTSLDEFRVAGGIVLGILGIEMALGLNLNNIEDVKNKSGRAIAAIIGTPLLTGPAAITAIIVSVQDNGRTITGLAILTVLAATALIFYQAEKVNKMIGKNFIQVMSTILGLVTLAWGVKFVTTGIMNILFG